MLIKRAKDINEFLVFHIPRHAIHRQSGMNGFLLIDKPTGISSFGALKQLNRHFQIQRQSGKLGHGGTLDPNASGLLVAAVGKATRLLRFFLGSDKRYLATVRFGMQTSTDDTEGESIAEAPFTHINVEQIEQALTAFSGTILQVPPNFSALHVDGKRAYQLARHGEHLELSPRQVTIHAIKLGTCMLPSESDLELDIACSGGTYIRSIARDLGLALHSRAHLAALRRTSACHFDIAKAHSLSFLLEQDHLEPFIHSCDEAMSQFSAVKLGMGDVIRLLHGQPVNLHLSEEGVYRIHCVDNGRMAAVVERKNGKNDIVRLYTADEFRTVTECQI